MDRELDTGFFRRFDIVGYEDWRLYLCL